MTPQLRRRSWYRHGPFLLLLVLAAFVRFWDISDRPWDSDELGALFRAQAATDFNSHLDQGVKIDGHPALVQTFLWYNEQVWKSSPLELKYLWGIFSLVGLAFYYAYFWLRMGRKTAFFTTTAMALLSWPVVLSIWVRPYTIAFLWLGVFIFSVEKMRRSLQLKHLWIILSGISFALIAYSHYMAALTAVVFLISQIAIRKISWKQSLIIAGLALLLYAPHGSVFIEQLKEGGLSWLSKPDLSFFKEHVYFIFNGSNLVLSYLGLMLLSGAVFTYIKGLNSKSKQDAIGFLGLWFGVFAIAFIYSVFRKPVLQNNALYFALPFLLAGISVLFQRLPSMAARFFNYIWIALLIFSLSVEKEHFTEGLQDRYASPIQAISKWEFNEYPKSTTIIDGPQDVMEFHLNAYPISKPLLLQKSQNPLILLDSVTQKAGISDAFNFVLNSGSDMHLQAYIWSHFEIKSSNRQGWDRNFFQGGEWFNAKVSQNSYFNTLKFMELKGNRDSFLFLDFKQLESPLGKINPNDVLIISVAIDGDAQKDTIERYDLVSALFQEGFNRALNQIDYRYTANTKIGSHFTDSSGIQWLLHPIKLSDIPNWDEKARLRISYERRNSNHARLKSNKLVRFHIRKVPGNPMLYVRKTHQTFGS